MVRTTLRQEGLVDQLALSNCQLTIIGEQGNLKERILTMGSQLGVKKVQIKNELEESNDSDILIFLGSSLPKAKPNSKYLRVLLLDDGVRVTTDLDAEGGTPSKLQEPGLCTIAAALTWQEVLKLEKLILPVEIPKKYITINLRVNPSNLLDADSVEDSLKLIGSNGVPLSFKVQSRNDGTGHMILQTRIDEGEPLADLIFQSIKIVPKTKVEKTYTSEIEIHIPRCDGKISGSFIVAGVGGLGSWAMHSIMHGVAESGSDGNGLDIHLVDPDLKVEIHNLNRQILYSHNDLGHPKAAIAAQKVRTILPGANVKSYNDAIGLPHLDAFSYELLDEDLFHHDEQISEEEFPEFSSFSLDLQNALGSANVILSGVDNLRSRSILNAISSHLGIPMVNAGAAGFVGNFDIFLDNQSCMICRYGRKAITQLQTMSCQEDGEVPFSSIVTSTALFGALEGLAIISALSPLEESLENWPSQIIWSGWQNKITCNDNHKLGQFNEVFSKYGTHSEHLRDLLFEEELE